MSSICPTVLAATPEDFHEQMAVVASCADRIQLDLGDGIFTTKTVSLRDVQLPAALTVDIHLMYDRILEVLPSLIALQPSMVIVHAEANDDLVSVIDHLHSHGIAAGLALLQKTEADSVKKLIKIVDHVLIFSGSLGSFGGKADLTLLRKVTDIRAIKPTIEIGWDGGINARNARQLAEGGIDILNVGGAIQKASKPINAYRELIRLIQD